MNLQEQHWQKLFGHVTTEGNPWYGEWTVYSPEQEVLKSSKGIRILQANPDKTVIDHINQFPSPDGSTQEKQWKIDKEACNQSDGLLHPADESKRALSLEGGGATAWVPKILKTEHPFSVELFLKHEDWNTSIGSIYDGSGCLEKILHLREHLGSFPNTPEKPPIKNLSGNWIGKKECMTPDTKISTLEETQELVLDPTQGKNETFFLPDGVVVNIPKRVNVGEEFELVAGRFVSHNEYKRLTAKYDKSGAFALLISEVFRQEE
jgi:hypothetical protein